MGIVFGRNSCTDGTSGSVKIVIARKRQRGETKGIGGGGGQPLRVGGRREYEEVDGWNIGVE